MWSAVALAFGLAMDATAVSAARGLAAHPPRERVLLPLLFGGFQSGMAALGWIAGRWAGPYIARWDHWVAFGLLVVIGGKMLLDAWRDGKGRAGPRVGGNERVLPSQREWDVGTQEKQSQASAELPGAGPRDATRGGVNFPALPGKRGRESPLLIDERAPAPATLALYLGLAIATSIDAAAAGITLPLVPTSPWVALTLIGSVTAACSAAGYVAGRFVGQRFGARLAMLGGLVLIGIGVQLLMHSL
jgi:putative Mn2+ efflux pump MntP